MDQIHFKLTTFETFKIFRILKRYYLLNLYHHNHGYHYAGCEGVGLMIATGEWKQIYAKDLIASVSLIHAFNASPC